MQNLVIGSDQSLLTDQPRINRKSETSSAPIFKLQLKKISTPLSTSSDKVGRPTHLISCPPTHVRAVSFQNWFPLSSLLSLHRQRRIEFHPEKSGFSGRFEFYWLENRGFFDKIL
jgi:hypothetical protein